MSRTPFRKHLERRNYIMKTQIYLCNTGLFLSLVLLAGCGGASSGSVAPPPVASPSQTTLASSVNPVVINQPTTLSATVEAVGTGTAGTGSVLFYDGTAAIGGCTLASGTCSYAATMTVVGQHTLTAVYGGNTNLATSTSNTVNETADAIPTAGYTAIVDPGTQYQTMEGWGVTLSWWANQVGGWSDPARSQFVDKLFAAPPNGLGLTYARYNIGGGDCPTCKSLSVGTAVPGYEPTAGTYNWTVDGNQRWVAQRAYQDGAVFFEAQSNSPPWWMTISGSSTGGVGGADNLSSTYQGTDANSFPSYLVTVADHFNQDFGITFREIDPFNEPDGTGWTDGNTQEGCAFSLPQQETVIQNTNTLLNGAGSITRIAANDDNSIGDAQTAITTFSPTTLGDMDEVNTHNYGSSSKSGTLSTAASTAGKRMVMSEWGSAEATGEDLSSHLVTGINNLHAVDWAVWQPDWPPLFKVTYSNQAISPVATEVYYVYANYTEFIRPGDIILSINDANSVAAYNAKTNTLTLVTYNWTSNDASVTYNLSRFNSVGTSATVYRTSSTENLASIGSVSLTGTSLVYTAKAGSVTTLVIPSAIYSPSVQPEIPATLNAAQGSSYTVPFNGTQARIYGSMGPSQSIIAYSVDGGAETDVDLYAATSSSDVLVYATPTLSSGAHVLKVRVTGLKNSQATVFTGQPNQVEIVN